MHREFQGIQKHLISCFFYNPYIKKLKKEQFVLILFNTKDQDLLHIHEAEDESNKTSKQKSFEILDL
jgi:hypothetical protein